MNRALTVKLPLLGLLLLGFVQFANSVEIFDFSSSELQARFQSLTEVLRCPKCQNQNLADSDSPISSDLRREIYLMLEEGQSDEQIKEFLVARYGTYVLYDPPVSGVTLWVWLVPVFFGLGGALLVWRVLRQASRRPIPADEELDEQGEEFLS